MPTPISPVVSGFKDREVIAGGPDVGQPEFLPLPVLVSDGSVVTRWQFTDEERQLIADGGELVLSITTGGTIPPHLLTVEAKSDATKEKENSR